MAYEEQAIVQEWLDNLCELNVMVKKMFGCYCLYCDGHSVEVNLKNYSFADYDYCENALEALNSGVTTPKTS